MAELKKLQDGWHLTSSKPLQSCMLCAVILGTPFNYCLDYNLGFCNDCATKTAGNLCHSTQSEHTHHNIIVWDKEKKDGN